MASTNSGCYPQSFIMMSYSEGNVPPPALPPRKVSPRLQPVDSENSATTSLQEADWYWGDITRDEVNEMMVDAPDGTFLVRNASSKAGEYTLTLRKGGCNKLIKISQRNGKFGFSEPFKFGSAVELINHYRNNSLAQYNSTLDIKLLYPVSRKTHQLQEEETWGAADVSKVAAKLVELHREYLKKTKEYDDYSEEFAHMSHEITLKHQALDAFREAIIMFRDQICLQEKFQKEAQPHEVKSLIKNLEMLKQRLVALEESRQKLEDNLREQRADHRTLERKMHYLKPDIIQLFKQRDRHQAWLKSRGVKPHRISQFLALDGSVPWSSIETEEGDLPHQDDSTWLLPACTRSEAEQLLSGRPDGTFLVRPSRTGQYALSIVCNGMKNHCIIYKTDRGFGFAEPYNIYDSLKSLVLHYAQNSLEEHNDSLTTTLAFPVFAQKPPNVPVRPISEPGPAGYVFS